LNLIEWSYFKQELQKIQYIKIHIKNVYLYKKEKK